MRRKYAALIATLILLATAPLLSACYTTKGAGQDIQAAGNGLSHSAEKNTHYAP